jgi:hypothetical protein
MCNRWILALLLAAGCALAASAQSKNSFTPMPLDSGFGAMDISAPPIAPEEIIRQFAANESEFQKALNHYTYRRAARVQTIDDDNKVDGEYYQVDDVLFDYRRQSASRRWSTRRRVPCSGCRCRPLTCKIFSAAISSFSPPR